MVVRFHFHDYELFLLTNYCQSQSHIMTDGRSVCHGVEPTLGLVTGYYSLSERCCLVSVGRPLCDERSGLSFVSLSVVMYIQHIQGFFQSWLGTADYALLITSSSCYNAV
jgi:hypothetical protein